MTQSSVALIVHEIMDSPERFTEDGTSITNGYYRVQMNGMVYGMGISKYQANDAEQQMLSKAIDNWKMETDWKPPAPIEVAPERPKIKSFDGDIKGAYEEFARVVRSNLKSFVVHGDAYVLTGALQKGVHRLDEVLRPMEKIEGGSKGAIGS